MESVMSSEIPSDTNFQSLLKNVSCDRCKTLLTVVDTRSRSSLEENHDPFVCDDCATTLANDGKVLVRRVSSRYSSRQLLSMVEDAIGRSQGPIELGTLVQAWAALHQVGIQK